MEQQAPKIFIQFKVCVTLLFWCGQKNSQLLHSQYLHNKQADVDTEINKKKVFVYNNENL